jgi:hypothetical protein
LSEGVRVGEPPLGDQFLDLGWGPGFAGGIGEVGSVVGEDGMDPIGDSLGEAAQEVRGGAAPHLLMQLDEGEFGGPVDRDDEI